MSETTGWTSHFLDALAADTGVAVDRGVRARHLAATDWGRMITQPPPAVIRPTNRDEVAATVRFAVARGLQLTMRATGASQSGQSISAGSPIVDLTGMHRVVIDGDVVECEPGATWRGVLAQSLKHGLAPRVMPLQLDLSVGGTISVGGLGSTSHRFGSAASGTVELEVVTGAGEVVTCSAKVQPDLFDAVRAGLGRCAAITRVRLATRKVGPVAHVAHLHYEDLHAWTGDFARASSAARITHLESFCRRGGGPRFELHLAADGPDASRADLEGVISGLSHARVAEVFEMPVMDYQARLDPRFEVMVASGRAGAAHPWVEGFTTLESLGEIAEQVLVAAAGDLRDRIQVILVNRAALPPLMPAPKGDLLACLVVVPVGVAAAEVQAAMDAMRTVNELILGVGGSRYLTGWLPDVSAAMWRRHFGDAYTGWVAAKHRYDPAGTFTSALFSAGESEAEQAD